MVFELWAGAARPLHRKSQRLDMACWRACRQVGELARPVSTLADEFGVCWWTGSSRRTRCISERESV